MNPVHYFWILLKASLFSTGGMGNLPSLHTDLLRLKWAHEVQFAESLIIGQVSPGPNGLWVVSLGYLTDGFTGALLAAIAVAVPPLLVIPLDRFYRSVKDHPAISGFVNGLSLAVIGAFSTTLLGMLNHSGLSLKVIIIGAAAFAAAATRKLPVPAIIGFAALVGIAWR